MKSIITGAVLAIASTILLASPALASPAHGGCANFPSWHGATCPRSPVIPWVDAGWRQMEAVPKAIYVGHDPFDGFHVLFITWDRWRTTSAYGHGDVIGNGQRRAGILLWRGRYSHGAKHYTRMRWTFRYGKAHITVRYALRYGYWHQTYPA